MTNDDLPYRHRLLLFAKVTELGVSRASREVGYHRSWYYRWKPLVERHGRPEGVEQGKERYLLTLVVKLACNFVGQRPAEAVTAQEVGPLGCTERISAVWWRTISSNRL